MFLAHLMILHTTPLSSRSFRCNDEHEPLDVPLVEFLGDFSRHSAYILQSDTWSDMIQEFGILSDIADLLDGRLLHNLFYNREQLVQNDEQDMAMNPLRQLLCAFTSRDLALPSDDPSVEKMQLPKTMESKTLTVWKVLPFSCRALDKYLFQIKLDVDTTATSSQVTARIHHELVHWHNAKRKINPVGKAAAMEPKQKKYQMRRNDRVMAETQAYAASLTNSVGKVLEPEIITVRDRRGKENKSKSEPHNSIIPTKEKRPTKKQAMLDRIASEQALKDAESEQKALQAWRTFRARINGEKSFQGQYYKIEVYLSNLPHAKSLVVNAEAHWNMLIILLQIASTLPKSSTPQWPRSDPRLPLFALIFDCIRKLAMEDSINEMISTGLLHISEKLGLPTISIPAPKVSRALAFDPELTVLRQLDKDPGMNGWDFQLRQAGPYMDRDLDSALDNRVSFVPDGWQRKVLDELDQNKSIFVVAPTSSGKTFISFYAMEKVLRADDDGVLVYVAPTKALVNQIAAEIQARFSKRYDHAGKSVWAIHTRDHRVNNATGCQILVTVPHILQIMLLAPTNARSWSPRVKYIIFDEIHSIGQAEDGVVWEQLLLLAPCPIIALSATVGNPQLFNEWLASTQRALGHEITMIQHHHRYSDLRKFVYQPPDKFSFQSLSSTTSFATLGLDGLDGFEFVHPVSALVDRSRGMPEDFSLEARDCLTLYNAMVRHQTPDFHVEEDLDPSAGALPNIIKKADVIKWEAPLKAKLRQWMSDSESPFDKVLQDLSHSKDVNQGENSEARMQTSGDESDDMIKNTLPMLCRLHERNALPAILFNYDRHACEMLCRSLINQLVQAEKLFKAEDQSWAKKMKAYDDWQRQKDVAAKSQKPAKKDKKKKGEDLNEEKETKADRMQDAANGAVNPLENFNPRDPVDGFHFAVKHKAEAKDFEQYIRLAWRFGLPAWQLEGLHRGIGVHHAGMNKRYRQIVEILFRKGFLRVVIATGTLALGINMPCATVVFSGDSVFLTALNYRQAAGRAGRRGFDLLGNVVFQGISRNKVNRLLSSRLPDLSGHFPVSQFENFLKGLLTTLIDHHKSCPALVHIAPRL